MTDLEMAAKFRKAATWLRTNGWQQGPVWTWKKGRVDYGGPCCGGGAMILALGGDTDEKVGFFNPLFWAATHWSEERNGIGFVSFNETPGRTANDVVAFFEGLAHDLELRHQIAASSTLPAETGKTLATNRQEAGVIA